MTVQRFSRNQLTLLSPSSIPMNPSSEYNASNEAVLSTVTEILYRTFDNRIYSVYLIGSRANGFEQRQSDVDTVVILRFQVNDVDSRLNQVARRLAYQETGCKLDIKLRSHRDVLRNGCEYIRLSSRRLLGNPLRWSIPLPPMVEYRTRVACAARSSIFGIRNFCLEEVKSLPTLEFPDKKQPEFGYLPSISYSNLKALMTLLANICRVILAFEYSLYVASKPQNLHLYEMLGCKHSEHITPLYFSCFACLDLEVNSKERLNSVEGNVWQSLLELERQVLAYKPEV